MTKLNRFTLQFNDPVLASEFEEYLFKKNEAVVRTNAVYVISPFLNILASLVFGLSYFVDASTGNYVRTPTVVTGGASCWVVNEARGLLLPHRRESDPTKPPSTIPSVVGLFILIVFNLMALSIDKSMEPHTFRVYTRLMALGMATIFIAQNFTQRFYSYGFRGDYSLDLILVESVQILICSFMLRCTFLECTVLTILFQTYDLLEGQLITGE